MNFAVFLLDHDEYVAISYGATEWECEMWILDHRQYFGNATLVVGVCTNFPYGN